MAEKDIDAPDWIDQDLLTRDEAAERLDEEIILVRERLARLEATPSGPDPDSAIGMVRRRLVAMEQARRALLETAVN
ncbi:hypothetical protein P5P86_09565 [Nocardioides sp. BP30]|uniref:hypothetical protein n=1 Tax=Nocardioides sp. BP30 TaxID=3036374 RepID=UPI00246942C7|nr:hypothetical protein [Nocardioides sp. BP30]WGL54059.1 hypothetical protein P5P86_09565 [Nocardioides sp. BP30]